MENMLQKAKNKVTELLGGVEPGAKSVSRKANWWDGRESFVGAKDTFPQLIEQDQWTLSSQGL